MKWLIVCIISLTAIPAMAQYNNCEQYIIASNNIIALAHRAWSPQEAQAYNIKAQGYRQAYTLCMQNNSSIRVSNLRQQIANDTHIVNELNNDLENIRNNIENLKKERNQFKALEAQEVKRHAEAKARAEEKRSHHERVIENERYAQACGAMPISKNPERIPMAVFIWLNNHLLQSVKSIDCSVPHLSAKNCWVTDCKMYGSGITEYSNVLFSIQNEQIMSHQVLR